MKKTDKIIVTTYRIKGKNVPAMKIALASDLHDRSPEEALRLLRLENPDLILAAGDLMERHEPGYTDWTSAEMDAWQGLSRRGRVFSKTVKFFDSFLPLGQKNAWDMRNGRAFLREASRIAPVYMGMGNHEWYFTDEDKKLMEECRVTLLDNSDTSFVFPNGQRIYIGGLSTRYDLGWLSGFAKKPGYKILICHHPEYYERFIRGNERDRFSLIVSGHAHGGQWRIGGRSILAPGQGLFPKYAYGIHDGKLVISAGLSNTANIPRFGNPRELVMIYVENEISFPAGE